ncbi:hypothetical protein M3M35_07130 [Fructilactobacillus myrtifloralis]|uniref:Phage protein n=1 Tax=Fructilactobacillus myrtifloralis TaxID=2940301 RepID=A0ABY5BNB5_9LACO|nr:hypothetical protein [Fructilactobacillus myrtifloralis]USS85055.1 hypothetical protein M3M35_07130 [Fructilactobacillus myrtifloralis]
MSDETAKPFLEVKAYPGENRTKSYARVEIGNKQELEFSLDLTSNLISQISKYGDVRPGVIALLVDVLGITDEDYKNDKNRVKEVANKHKAVNEADKIIKKAQQKGEDK